MNSKIIFLLIFNHLFSILDATTTESYITNTRIVLESYVGCKGPRSRDCSILTYKKISDTKLTMDVDIKEDFALTSGKTEGFSSGNLIFRFRAKNPCDHFMIQVVYRAAINITDNCIVKKGKYVLSLDVMDMGKRFYKNFPVATGNLTIVTKYYGKNCNFICSTAVLSFRKE